jgi:phosphate-selective porin
LNIVRATAIVGTQIVLLIASGGQTRGAEFLGSESVPERQTATDWPPGALPGIQAAALVEGQGPSPPQVPVQKLSENLSAEATPASAASMAPADADPRPRLNAYWDYGAVLESSDKAFRLHVGGCLEFDNTFYGPLPTLPFTLQDGADMRRARLRADGTIGRDVDFVTEVNFANIQDVTNEDATTNIGSVGLNDFYVAFNHVPVVENLRLGHFQQPIGLEHSTGANTQYYMEQSDGHDAFFQPF